MKETWICPICNTKFEFNKRTALRQQQRHLLKCQNIQKFENLLGIKFTKEEIEKLLINKFGSANELNKFCKENNIHLNFHRICNEYGIKISISNSKKNPIVKKRQEQTFLKHFGTSHNFCKNSSSRKEWENRLLQEEGIINVFQRESVKQKIKQSTFEKYGENAYYLINSKEYKINKWINNGLTLEEANKKWEDECYRKGNSMRISYFKEKYGEDEGYKKFVQSLEKRAWSYINNSSAISSLNIKFQQMLDSLNIQYKSEFKLQYDDENNQPKFLYYDFLIENYIFEINGDYWHASPKIYKETDLIKYPGNLILSAKEVWERDLFKKDLAELNGYKVIYFWESDINNIETWNKIVKLFEHYANSKN